MKVKQRYDGKGWEVPSGKVGRMVCCDCGLIHDMVFISQDGNPIGVAAKRNKKATKKWRRRGIKK